MKHFIVFLVLVFSSLFIFTYWKNKNIGGKDHFPLLRVYATPSFVSQWGPGPVLKEQFESTCRCRVEFFEGSDAVILTQRLKSESKQASVDVVIGFDQYDLEYVQKEIEWSRLGFDRNSLDPAVKEMASHTELVPYDWGVISFVGHANLIQDPPKKFTDLLSDRLKDQVSIPDPRVSSLGLQLLIWLIHTQGENEAFNYLNRLNQQVKSYGASWSQTYGLFQKKIVSLTLSYATSPVYHRSEEEKETDVGAYEFKEGHPIQVEFVGVPKFCHHCDLAKQFVSYMLSSEGQKIIMEKNYMFPVLPAVKEGTLFENIGQFKLLDMPALPSQMERERLLKRWTKMRLSQ